MAQIPLRYSIRNLFRRKLRTCLTVLGLGLALATVVFMLSFNRSLAAAVRQTGDPDNIIIISKKAQSHILSSISSKDCDQIRNKLHDYTKAFTHNGVEEPIISLEIYMGITVEIPDSETAGQHRAVIHGIDPDIALNANNFVELTEGRLPEENKNELICGDTAGARIGLSEKYLETGKRLRFTNKDWTIVGKFKAPGTLMESEIWTHSHDLRNALKRQDYSFIRCKLKDPDRMDSVIERISTDEQFKVKAFAEQTFFADYATGFDYFRHFALLLTVLITIGGIITGMNTMYTAIMGRIREIGTLQVIGFSKTSVLIGILVESTIISITGGLLGVLLGMVTNGIPVKIPMAAFRVNVDSTVILWTFIAALGIGFSGAIVPSWRALKLRMVDAVRYE